MTNSPRLVLDTNIIVSALLFPQSIPRQAFTRAIQNGAVLISMPVLAELEEVLRRKRFDHYLSQQERMQFLEYLVANARWVEIHQSIAACRDPRDDKFLELAVDGQADCLISGDNDLLVLDPFRGIPIMNPKRFLEACPPPSAPPV